MENPQTMSSLQPSSIATISNALNAAADRGKQSQEQRLRELVDSKNVVLTSKQIIDYNIRLAEAVISAFEESYSSILGTESHHPEVKNLGEGAKARLEKMLNSEDNLVYQMLARYENNINKVIKSIEELTLEGQNLYYELVEGDLSAPEVFVEVAGRHTERRGEVLRRFQQELLKNKLPFENCQAEIEEFLKSKLSEEQVEFIQNSLNDYTVSMHFGRGQLSVFAFKFGNKTDFQFSVKLASQIHVADQEQYKKLLMSILDALVDFLCPTLFPGINDDQRKEVQETFEGSVLVTTEWPLTAARKEIITKSLLQQHPDLKLDVLSLPIVASCTYLQEQPPNQPSAGTVIVLDCQQQQLFTVSVLEVGENSIQFKSFSGPLSKDQLQTQKEGLSNKFRSYTVIVVKPEGASFQSTFGDVVCYEVHPSVAIAQHLKLRQELPADFKFIDLMIPEEMENNLPVVEDPNNGWFIRTFLVGAVFIPASAFIFNWLGRRSPPKS